MRSTQRSAQGPIHDFDVSERPVPPRIVALQAIADPSFERQERRSLVPVAVVGLLILLAWILLPDRASLARVLLTAVTLIFAAGGAWLLRRRSDDVAAVLRAPGAAVEEPRPDRLPPMPRDFRRFMEDGIVVSRRSGRTAALLRITFLLPAMPVEDRDGALEAIGDNARDVTRAYDFVHVPGDGTICIFIAHVQPEANLQAVARRIVEDLRRCGGPAFAARRVDVQAAGLEQDTDDAAALVGRTAASAPFVLSR